jgi:1,4-alpha-glucan branching enzyme
MIRLATYAMGGEGYLCFMGNEFGHPEWLDFPRQGNRDSFRYARRQFNLVRDPLLRYRHLADFDKAMLSLPLSLQSSGYGHVSLKHELDRVLVFERGGLVFMFNWHPTQSLVDYRVGLAGEGEYRVVLDSDGVGFGGFGRVEGEGRYWAERVEWCGRPFSTRVYLPCRSALVIAPVQF